MAGQLVVAATIEEALKAKQAGGVFLAGGTEINRLDSLVEAETLVSIRKIPELTGIHDDGDEIRIGALTTFEDAVECDLIPDWFKEACLFMASRTKRNMATIAGNIAIMRTDSYVIPTLIATGAKLVLVGDEGEHECTVLDYIGGSSCGKGGASPYAGELIKEIVLVKDPGCVFSKRYANTAQSHARLTAAFAAKSLDEVEMAAAVKNGGIYYLTDLMKAIKDDHDVSEDALVDMVMNCDGAEFPTDIFGGEKYKRYLLGVTVAEFLAKAKKGGLS